jgi:hypothetical protein
MSRYTFIDTFYTQNGPRGGCQFVAAVVSYWLYNDEQSKERCVVIDYNDYSGYRIWRVKEFAFQAINPAPNQFTPGNSKVWYP